MDHLAAQLQVLEERLRREAEDTLRTEELRWRKLCHRAEEELASVVEVGFDTGRGPKQGGSDQRRALPTTSTSTRADQRRSGPGGNQSGILSSSRVASVLGLSGPRRASVGSDSVEYTLHEPSQEADAGGSDDEEADDDMVEDFPFTPIPKDAPSRVKHWLAIMSKQFKRLRRWCGDLRARVITTARNSIELKRQNEEYKRAADHAERILRRLRAAASQVVRQEGIEHGQPLWAQLLRSPRQPSTAERAPSLPDAPRQRLPETSLSNSQLRSQQQQQSLSSSLRRSSNDWDSERGSAHSATVASDRQEWRTSHNSSDHRARVTQYPPRYTAPPPNPPPQYSPPPSPKRLEANVEGSGHDTSDVVLQQLRELRSLNRSVTSDSVNRSMEFQRRSYESASSESEQARPVSAPLPREASRVDSRDPSRSLGRSSSLSLCIPLCATCFGIRA